MHSSTLTRMGFQYSFREYRCETSALKHKYWDAKVFAALGVEKLLQWLVKPGTEGSFLKLFYWCKNKFVVTLVFLSIINVLWLIERPVKHFWFSRQQDKKILPQKAIVLEFINFVTILYRSEENHVHHFS